MQKMKTSQNNKALPTWPRRLIEVYVHLIWNTFDELRAVIAKSSPELLEIYFYHDGELENKKWDACSIITCEVWDPDFGEELISDIIRLDTPQPIPSLKEGEFYLYRRKEPFEDPISKKELDSTSFEELFLPITPGLKGCDLHYFDINAFFGEALVGEIIPCLREIFVLWDKTTILSVFVYHGELNEGKIRHAKFIIEKIRSKFPTFTFILRIEKLNFPLTIPSPEYEPEFDEKDPQKIYKIKFLGKEIPFPVVGYSRFAVFKKMD